MKGSRGRRAPHTSIWPTPTHQHVNMPIHQHTCGVYLQCTGHHPSQSPVAVAAPAELQPGGPYAQVCLELAHSTLKDEVDPAHDGEVCKCLLLLAWVQDRFINSAGRENQDAWVGSRARHNKGLAGHSVATSAHEPEAAETWSGGEPACTSAFQVWNDIVKYLTQDGVGPGKHGATDGSHCHSRTSPSAPVHSNMHCNETATDCDAACCVWR
jgi:hypothetical protein